MFHVKHRRARRPSATAGGGYDDACFTWNIRRRCPRRLFPDPGLPYHSPSRPAVQAKQKNLL